MSISEDNIKRIKRVVPYPITLIYFGKDVVESNSPYL